MGVQVGFPDNPGKGELEHLPQFADMAQNLRVLQALGNVGRRALAGLRKIRFEQRGIRQQSLATGGSEVVQQRQQHQRKIVFAAGQMLEILGELKNGLHQYFNRVVDVGDGLVEYGLSQLLHFLGQQGGAVKLDHLQSAVNLVEIVQAKAQPRCVVPIVDKRFQGLLALGQRVLYFAANPVQGDAVMVIAHNHSGYSSSGWRLIHASTCSDGTLCKPGGCQSVSSPWPRTSNPPGASRSASRFTISLRRQRRK